MVWLALLMALIFLMLILDTVRWLDVTKGLGRFFTAFLYPHMVLICYTAYENVWKFKGKTAWVIFLVFMSACILCWLARLHLFPFRNDKSGSLRVRILYGGRILIHYGLWSFFLQAVWLLALTGPTWQACYNTGDIWVFWTDLAVMVIVIFWIFVNGALRIICTSRRLGLGSRFLMFFALLIPVIQLIPLTYLCRKAKEEYDHECCRHEIRELRAASFLCATKYPILLLHGVGFRDHRLFNYWGRIPKELVRNGAVIYYGHQEGWGVIEDNAVVIKERIEQMLEENQCEKINIIAHSKGGLDARYTINTYGMADKVASLTTICTPHQGSPLVPFLRHMPEKMYRMICGWIDQAFLAYGDKRPDVYRSSLQLHPVFCEEFNRCFPNQPGVYYQSYTSAMKHWYSESLLSVPYMVLKRMTGQDNDGLVPEESAKWGEFRGTFHTGGWRGVSHADMIDLYREDYKGFDVVEYYVKIVNELKMMGF